MRKGYSAGEVCKKNVKYEKTRNYTKKLCNFSKNNTCNLIIFKKQNKILIIIDKYSKIKYYKIKEI